MILWQFHMTLYEYDTQPLSSFISGRLQMTILMKDFCLNNWYQRWPGLRGCNKLLWVALTCPANTSPGVWEDYQSSLTCETKPCRITPRWSRYQFYYLVDHWSICSRLHHAYRRMSHGTTLVGRNYGHILQQFIFKTYKNLGISVLQNPICLVLFNPISVLTQKEPNLQ